MLMILVFVAGAVVGWALGRSHLYWLVGRALQQNGGSLTLKTSDDQVRT